MAKVRYPIQEVWDEVDKNPKAPIELVRASKTEGIVRVKKVKAKERKNDVGNEEVQ